MSEISREELKQHCIKTIAVREEMNKNHKIHFTSDKTYQEHKLVLDMIKKLEKVEKVIDDIEDYEHEDFEFDIRQIEQILRGGRE